MRPNTKLDDDDKELILALVKEGMCYREIAEKWDTDKMTICRVVKKQQGAGLALTDHDKWLIKQLHAEGMSMAEIGRKFEVTGTTISRAIFGRRDGR